MAITITTPTPLTPTATVGVPYSIVINRSGGTGPYQWMGIGLPAGLMLGTSGGSTTLSGTPSIAANPITFTIQVESFGGTPDFGEKEFTLVINSAPGGSTTELINLNTTDGTATDNTTVTSFPLRVGGTATSDTTLAALPLYRNTGGEKFLYFNANLAEVGMRFPTVGYGSAMTIILVARQKSVIAAHRTLNTTTGNWLLGFGRADDIICYNNSGTVASSETDNLLNVKTLAIQTIGATGGGTKTFLNKTDITTANSITTIPGRIVIGSENSGSQGAFVDADIFIVRIFTGELTTAQRELMENDIALSVSGGGLTYFYINQSSLPDAPIGTSYNQPIAVANRNASITSATVSQGTLPTGLSLTVDNVSGSTIGARINGTTGGIGTTAMFELRLVDGAGKATRQTFSITTTGGSSDTTPPSDVGIVTPSVINSNQINLSWTAATDNIGVTDYKVDYALTSDFLTGLVSSDIGSSIPSRSVTGLVPSTSYYFRVKAKDAAGNYSVNWSPTAIATTLSSDSTTLYTPFEKMLASITGAQDVTIVTVILTSPSSLTKTTGGFYVSGTLWKWRYNFNEIGTWTWSATVSGQTTQTGSISVSNSSNKGWVKIHPSDNQAWVYQTNAPANFRGIGDCVYNRPALSDPIRMGMDEPTNLVVTTDAFGNKFVELTDYLAAYGNGKFNLFRWSVDNCSFKLQTAIGSGGVTYDFTNAITGDGFIQQLRAYGFRIQFCFLNGIGTTIDTSTGAVRNAYKKYIKYCVDRYGAYVDFWEIVNEGNTSATDPFVNDLTAYIKTIDTYRHPISNSFETFAGGGNTNVHDLTETEFTSPHYYDDPSPLNEDILIPSYLPTLRSYNKPIIIGESGYIAQNYSVTSDIQFRIRSWAAEFNKATLIWWNTSWSKTYAPGGTVSNAYIGVVARPFIGYLTTFMDDIPSSTRSPASVSSSSTIRGYVLSSLNIYAAYIHAYADHTATITGQTITVNPQSNGTATWYNPSTGSVLGTPQSLIAGSQTLNIPNFSVDIALKIVGGAPDTTPPNDVGTITPTTIGQNNIILDWADVVPSIGTIEEYRIERSLSNTFSSSTIINTGSSTSIYNVTGLATNTPYYFRIKAKKTNGVYSLNWSPTLSVTTLGSTDTTPPTVPSNLQGTVQSSTSVNLTWNASTDNVGVTGYDLQRSISPTFLTGVTTINLGNVLTYSDTGLSPSTQYFYRVRAHDFVPNNSAYSSPAISVTTTIPAANRLMIATWNPSVNATNYRLKRATAINMTTNLVIYLLGNVTTYQDITGVEGTRYYWTIEAGNTVGYSAPSTVVDVFFTNL